MSTLITPEMKIRTAKNIYDEIISVKSCLLSGHKDSLFTAEEVMEKIGYVIQSCVREIMNELEVEDDYCGENFGIILECIEDDDTFEYMMKALNFNEPKVEKERYTAWVTVIADCKGDK